MDPVAFKPEWAGHTVLHPLGLAALLVLGTAMLLVPRRYSVWPMILMACFIPPAQRITVVGLNFDMMRLMILFGTARLLLRQEYTGLRLRLPDFVFIAWSSINLIALTVQSGTGLKYALGETYDIMGSYFLFRCLVRDWNDLRTAVMGFVWVSIPTAAAFIVESRTGRNLFGFMGGVPEITDVRDGRLRCQGAFAHPILAGCFWASMLPLMAALFFSPGKTRILSIIGCVTAGLIIVLCASSTPIAAVAFGIIGSACFLVRRYMWLIRWGLLFLVIGLHFSMKAPVYHLISRIDLAGGSTSYHRYNLIEQAINHIDEWWLLGSSVGSAHWGYGLVDVTNTYIVQCLHGGLGQLALFITVIALAFRQVGRMSRAYAADRTRKYLAWALGVSVFVHVTSFVGVSYFGQTNMIWYMTLAMITSLSTTAAVAAPVWRARRVPAMVRAGTLPGGAPLIQGHAGRARSVRPPRQRGPGIENEHGNRGAEPLGT